MTTGPAVGEPALVEDADAEFEIDGQLADDVVAVTWAGIEVPAARSLGPQFKVCIAFARLIAHVLSLWAVSRDQVRPVGRWSVIVVPKAVPVPAALLLVSVTV